MSDQVTTGEQTTLQSQPQKTSTLNKWIRRIFIFIIIVALPLSYLFGYISRDWINRIGILLNFCGSFLIAPELLGPKRLKDFEVSLKDSFERAYIFIGFKLGQSVSPTLILDTSGNKASVRLERSAVLTIEEIIEVVYFGVSLFIKAALPLIVLLGLIVFLVHYGYYAFSFIIGLIIYGFFAWLVMMNTETTFEGLEDWIEPYERVTKYLAGLELFMMQTALKSWHSKRSIKGALFYTVIMPFVYLIKFTLGLTVNLLYIIVILTINLSIIYFLVKLEGDARFRSILVWLGIIFLIVGYSLQFLATIDLTSIQQRLLN
jgi:hypothetical protein